MFAKPEPTFLMYSFSVLLVQLVGVQLVQSKYSSDI
jgi:hypothetical protein